MARPEQERPSKNVDYDHIVLTHIFNLGFKYNFVASELLLDQSTEIVEEDGTKIITVKPYELGSKPIEKITKKFNRYLLYVPLDVSKEKNAYLIQTGERDWVDGETTIQIVMSKIPSPDSFDNKRDWVDKVVNSTLNPQATQEQFQKEDIKFPTLLITLYRGGVSASYAGKIDTFMAKVYSFFPGAK